MNIISVEKSEVLPSTYYVQVNDIYIADFEFRYLAEITAERLAEALSDKQEWTTTVIKG